MRASRNTQDCTRGAGKYHTPADIERGLDWLELRGRRSEVTMFRRERTGPFRISCYWTRIFAVSFGMVVVSGIIMGG